MRNGFVTRFWQNAYASLPESTRERYLAELHAAERWELRLDALVGTFSRAKQLLARHAPAH